MHSSGYFFDESKSAGLIKTPSISAPSVDFHDTSSRVPNEKFAVCAVIFVNTCGSHLSADVTKSSFKVVGEPAVNAIRPASLFSEKPPASKPSGWERRANFPVTGSRRKSCAAVFCSAVKYIPFAFHSNNPAFSSKSSVIDLGVPPSTKTTASRVLVAKVGNLPIEVEKTNCFPSGDHLGPVSGPGCDTILRTVSSFKFKI